MTHGNGRHGTTTHFAALKVLDGAIIGRNVARAGHQEFINFVNGINAEVRRATPAELANTGSLD